MFWGVIIFKVLLFKIGLGKTFTLEAKLSYKLAVEGFVTFKLSKIKSSTLESLKTTTLILKFNDDNPEKVLLKLIVEC